MRCELVVAVGPLHALVALLGLDREGRDRPGLETLQRDRLAGLLAVAVGAVLDPAESLVDLRDQLALAVAGAELQGTVGLERGAIGDVGLREAFFLEMAQSLVRLLQQLRLPAKQ